VAKAIELTPVLTSKGAPLRWKDMQRLERGVQMIVRWMCGGESQVY